MTTRAFGSDGRSMESSRFERHVVLPYRRSDALHPFLGSLYLFSGHTLFADGILKMPHEVFCLSHRDGCGRGIDHDRPRGIRLFARRKQRRPILDQRVASGTEEKEEDEGQEASVVRPWPWGTK